MRAIGSGGLEGEGFLKGTSVHSNFIPFAYSDSIFVVVGEEFGFRGSAVLLLDLFLSHLPDDSHFDSKYSAQWSLSLLLVSFQCSYFKFLKMSV